MLQTKSSTNKITSDIETRCFHVNNYLDSERGWWSTSGEWVDPHLARTKINYIFKQGENRGYNITRIPLRPEHISSVALIKFLYEMRRDKIKQELSEKCKTCGEEW